MIGKGNAISSTILTGTLLWIRRWLRKKTFALLLWLDDRRISQHLKRIEQWLRARDVNTISLQLQLARKRNLDNLKEYWRRGEFPRNYGQLHQPYRYAPCFIDHHGRMCAVAHLVTTSGHIEAAHHIADKANHANIEEMKFPELDVWVAASGLSKDELALIQPMYTCPETCIASIHTMITTHIASNLWWIITGGITGIIVSVVNIVNIYRQRWKLLRYGSVLGIVVGVALIYLAITIMELWVDVSFAGVPCNGAPFGSCSTFMSQNLNLEDALSPLNQQIRTSCIQGILFVIASLGGLLFSIYRIRKTSRKRQSDGLDNQQLAASGPTDSPKPTK